MGGEFAVDGLWVDAECAGGVPAVAVQGGGDEVEVEGEFKTGLLFGDGESEVGREGSCGCESDEGVQVAFYHGESGVEIVG